jgi:hypothetical protein
MLNLSVQYDESVFINCPFDDLYHDMFHGIIFAVHDCGFVSRCALEVIDSTEGRIGKIMRIIGECRYGVHDLSRTELNKSGLPRFNMPLELGLFLGCKEFGIPPHDQKNCLVLDTEQYRYHQFISDIAGQDISAHQGDVLLAIVEVRNWLSTVSGRQPIPGGKEIAQRFQSFQADLPAICQTAKTTPEQLTFGDYQYMIGQWLTVNAW